MVKDSGGDVVQLSVVMPCLNEEATIGSCIRKALSGIGSLGLVGEVVVADNGSTDRSVEIAEELGARVVHQPIRGYGAAYLLGISAARGEFIVMGDSDDTYDLSDLGRFVAELRDGCDLVIGSRLKGTILPGAMPWSHRYVGNPVLSGMLRVIYRTDVSDSHCGMRAFTRDALRRMELQSIGMEFASEMVIKSVRAGLVIREIPIEYHPRLGESKLRSFRDGLRHVRFMLLLSPLGLSVAPGAVLTALGLIGLVAMSRGPIHFRGHGYDVHVMTLVGFMTIVGYQLFQLGICARGYAVSTGLLAARTRTPWWLRAYSMERGLMIGLVVFLCGVAVDGRVALEWARGGFGRLDEVRTVFLGLTLMVLGVQTGLWAVVLGIVTRPRQVVR